MAVFSSMTRGICGSDRRGTGMPRLAGGGPIVEWEQLPSTDDTDENRWRQSGSGDRVAWQGTVQEMMTAAQLETIRSNDVRTCSLRTGSPDLRNHRMWHGGTPSSRQRLSRGRLS